MKNESQLTLFNDVALQNLARYNLFSTFAEFSNEERAQVEGLIKRTKLDNKQRNFLIEFCAKNRQSKPKSMREMKNEILERVGFAPESSSTNVLSAKEVKAIYDWFCENFQKGK